MLVKEKTRNKTKITKEKPIEKNKITKVVKLVILKLIVVEVK